eukprot:TRINITY_DN1214_c0_g3_i2.p1 TRINITY_DN1214_c0_g3~~TRINITY_DN1214_c0_g3_i2.p1  ORF type:complete len:850 (-),score=135.94 TRINITY_DN1214_c0_g3_i2:170-2719(-)
MASSLGPDPPCVAAASVFRQFAFVGFRNPADAQTAADQLNRTYFDTSKILVEPAHAPGAESLARPWSRHAHGSTAHRKQHPELYGDVEITTGSSAAASPSGAGSVSSAKQRAAPKVAPGARSVKLAAVKPTKAGVNSNRVHTQFASSDDEADVETTSVVADTASKNRDDEAAFDDELSDLAYLRAKSASSNGSKSLATVGTVIENVVQVDSALDGQSAKPHKKSKKVKKKEADTANEAAKPAGTARENSAPRSTAAVLAAAAAEDATNAERATANGTSEGSGRHGNIGSAEREELESSGRLYVTNLPYGASEEELRAHFEPLGEMSSVVICKDEDTLKSRGFGYVTFVFPECAVRALSELDLASFQGRLLRVTAARAKPQPVLEESADGGKSSGSSYKRQRELKRKKVEAHLEHTWNLLYVSANAAADAVAGQLKVSKGELFGKDADNAAVSAALTETSVIQQTKLWLQREGIRVDAFEQTGASLQKCRAAGLNNDSSRRDDAFIVKHLPAGANVDELRERFARYGELSKCSLAPSGTVAIVQYADKGHAQRAFQKLAFARYRHVPLYLEWAPEGVFVEPVASGNLKGDEEETEDRVKQDDEGMDDDEGQRGCLFVKNLSFSTTDAGLKAAFSRCKGFRSAVIMKKKASISAKGGKQQEDQSMGYGFLEFDSPALAADVLRRKQGAMLDGHALQLQVSQRNSLSGSKQPGKTTGKKSSVVTSSRICVRNLAFEANRKELTQLFGAYGNVTSVRIPKKSDYSGHRGFAFIDFASKTEAAAAFEALQHTHLYGRRLVIEPAEEKASDVGSVQETAKKRMASKELNSEAKKRRRSGLLHASGDAGSFKDALT